MRHALNLLTALLLASLAFRDSPVRRPPRRQLESFRGRRTGFGDVRVELRTYRQGEQKNSWTTFQAEDAGHAHIVGSKRLADLLGFGDIKPAADSKLPGTVLELEGAGAGCWASRMTAFTNCSRRINASLANWRSPPGRRPGPRSPSAYPRWLDCFDNAGPGIWWGGGGASVDIDSEFPWMKERGLAFNFHPPNEGRYVAPGVLDTTQTDWFAALAARFDIPFRVHCWERSPPGCGTASRCLTCAAARAGGRPTSGLPGPAWPPPLRLGAGFRQRPLQPRLPAPVHGEPEPRPNFLGSKAVAEIPDAGVGVLAAVAGMPETKAYWHSYLVHVLGLDLPKVGLLHHGCRDFYRSWEQVEVPLLHEFLGLDEHSVDLAGRLGGRRRLRYREVCRLCQSRLAAEPQARPGKGLGRRPLQRPDAPDVQRRPARRHQVRRLLAAPHLHRRAGAGRTAEIPAPGPPSRVARQILRRLSERPPLKQVTADRFQGEACAFALDDGRRGGENQLVLRMEGIPPLGHIALGPLPPRPYPRMTAPENRRWYDTVNFSAWLRMRGVEQTLQAMRAADPNRPLKMMATINMLDMSTDLCERYGAYQHDTGGAAGYWCPMTGGRLARSHGSPWSCEQGGPPGNAADFQSHITFYVMYGNDAADLVFATTHYKDKPDVAAWFDKNLELIKCIGKMHLPTPKIGVLRSTAPRGSVSPSRGTGTWPAAPCRASAATSPTSRSRTSSTASSTSSRS